MGKGSKATPGLSLPLPPEKGSVLGAFVCPLGCSSPTALGPTLLSLTAEEPEARRGSVICLSNTKWNADGGLTFC